MERRNEVSYPTRWDKVVVFCQTWWWILRYGLAGADRHAAKLLRDAKQGNSKLKRGHREFEKS
jgi:hypothetical protein